MRKFRIIVFLLLCFMYCSNNFLAVAISEDSKLSIFKVAEICLKENYNIKKMNVNVSYAKNRWRELKGGFDYSLFVYGTKSHQEKNILEENGDILDTGIILNKLLSNGISLSTTIDNKSIKMLNSNQGNINYSLINFKIGIPVFKNAGRKNVYAFVDAAKYAFISEKLKLKNQIRKSIKNVLIAYWEYLESKLILEERKKAEERARALVRKTEIMVKKNEVAQAEIIQYQGDLNIKISSTITAKRTLYEARLNLGRLLGLGLIESIALPLPEEDFPETGDICSKKRELLDVMIENSLDNRFDYEALKLDKKAVSLLFQSAKKNRLPEFGINFEVGYNGYAYGNRISNFWNSLTENISGLNFQVGLNYNFPLENNKALGILKQRYSDLKKIDINERELSLSIKMNVLKYYKQVFSLLDQYNYAKKSTKNYKLAIKNEKIKYGLNMSTQLNVIETEKNYIEAAINEIRIKKRIAISIVNLRYEKGELGCFRNNKFVIDKENLISFPSVLLVKKN